MTNLQRKLMRPTKMFQHNAYVVLELVQKKGPISRAEISRTLGFSKSAVSNIIAFLEQEGLIRFTGVGQAAVGKKPLLLEFNSTSHFVVSVDLRWRRGVAAVVDLSGKVERKRHVEVVKSNPKKTAATVAAAVRDVCGEVTSAGKPIEGIGILVPGVVNNQCGDVLYSATLKWDTVVHFGEMVSQDVDYPVSLENDANAIALGETWIGHGRESSVVFTLFMGEGIGGALIVDGEVLKGADFAAAEIGKTVMSSGGRTMEQMLSIPAVVSEYRHACKLSSGRTTYEAFFRKVSSLLEDGDDAAVSVTMSVVNRIALLLSHVVLFYNPEIVILDSPLNFIGENLVELLAERTQSYLPAKPERTVTILHTSLPRDSGLIGGAAVALANSRFGFIITGRRG